MSNPSEDPESIQIEDILPIPKRYHVRDPHSPADIQRLVIDINQKGRLTKPIRIVAVNDLYPNDEKYRTKYALVGGTARLIALKVLKVKELRVGLDVFIEHNIHDLQTYSLEVWHEDDLSKPMSWIARVKQTKVWIEEFRLTQERIAKEMGLETQATISKYHTIAKVLPADVIDDPFIEELGLTNTLSLARMWRKNEHDGREHLERLKGQHGSGEAPSELPSEKRLAEVALVYENTGSLAKAYGDKDYDNSPPMLEDRVDRALKLWAEKSGKDSTKGPPFRSIGEAWDARRTLDDMKRGPAADRSLIFTLEMMRDEMQSFRRRKTEWSPGESEAMIDKVFNEIHGIVEKSKEQPSKSGPTTPPSESDNHLMGMKRKFQNYASTHREFERPD